jgi:preprotein translocase subunit SecD
MKRKVFVLIGVFTGVLLLVFYVILTRNSAIVTSEHVANVTEKIDQTDKVVDSSFVSDSNTQNHSSDSKNDNTPQPLASPLQEESKPTAFKQHADANPLAGTDMPFSIQWLSDSEARRIPFNDLLSKAKVQSRESIKLHPIKTRQEAANQLNVNISFANFPSKAFESSDHFFFSAPLTQDFSRGFIINKETGEISTW